MIAKKRAAGDIGREAGAQMILMMAMMETKLP